MKKKSSPTQLALENSFDLYKDDLEEIVAKLSEDNREVVIEDHEYKYDSLDEVFQKRGLHPKRLSIYTREPYVIFNVRIKPGHTTLATSGDGQNLAPYYAVKEIIQGKTRKGIGMLVSGPSLLLMVVTSLLLWSYFDKHYGSQGFWFWLRFILISGVMLTAIVTQTLYGQGAYTVLTLKRRHEQPSFWERNKDELIKQIISHVVSFLLGLLAAYLLFVKGIN